MSCDASEARPLELLTSSRMRCFRECARKHDLSYVQGYRPSRTAEALRFGTLVHAALEAYWKAIQDWQRDSTIIESAPLGAALQAIQRFPGSDAFEKIRAEEMICAYVRQWGASDPHAYEVVAVETRFDAPLLNPETMHASKTWRLAGKVDVVLRRRSDDRVLVGESKTTSDAIESDADHYWEKLAIDGQISGYVLGAESMGHQCDEVLYDVLKKPAMRPLLATPMDARKFTAAGVLYASQRALDETAGEYRLRVRAALLESPDKYLQRKSIPRSNSQIEDWMFDAWQQSGMMRESARLGRSPRNAEACHRMGTCPFWTLCSTGGKPADYPADFTKLADVHPELAEETR